MLDALHPLRPGRGGRVVGSRGDSVFTLDAAAGAILDATARGWRFWGLDAACVTPPVPIDRAMPALQALVQARDLGPEPVLLFWTRHGVVPVRCVVEGMGQARFVVRVSAPHSTHDGMETAPLEAGRAVTGAGLAGFHGARPAPDEVTANARLAHELRTPLGAAMAYAEVLKDERFGPIGNARYRDYARHIYDSTRHALGVVEGMLAGHSRRGAGVPELVFADLDVAAVVASCIAVARPLADEARLHLSAEIGARLPRVIADEVSLRQMLLNLLTNAIKFTRPGDRIVVRAACELEGPLCITVTDTGPGIDPADCQSVARRPSAGLGIGLPLTHALAEANGAALTIESAPGSGTEVTIAFGKDRLVPV
jgi:signal transduction histidine kinase